MENEGQGFTREDLEAFLATAPDPLKDWASRQLAQFDEGRATSEAPPSEADAADLADLLPDYEQADDTPVAKPARTSGLERRTGVSRLNLVLVAFLAAAIVIIVQMAGRPQPQQPMAGMPSNHPPVDASAIAELDQAQKIDKEREAELKAQIEADPANIDARLQLSTMYYNAALYQEAIPLLQQVLDQDPDHLEALLGMGAAEYGASRYDDAEKRWLRITELDPTRQEPWYSLGFLYMARTPADPERARQAWNKVVEIDPNSELAKEVSVHLGKLATPTAAPTSEG